MAGASEMIAFDFVRGKFGLDYVIENPATLNLLDGAMYKGVVTLDREESDLIGLPVYKITGLHEVSGDLT